VKGLMGAFMIVAAFQAEWRKPILTYRACEKAFMVYLVVANVTRPYSQGFRLGAMMDATVVLYAIAYFAVGSCSETPSTFSARPGKDK
jgi:hypothetical protein